MKTIENKFLTDEQKNCIEDWKYNDGDIEFLDKNDNIVKSIWLNHIIDDYLNR